MPTIRANNSDVIKDRQRTWLTASIAAGVTALTVKDATGFDETTATTFILIGELGSETSEIVSFASATEPHAMVVGTTVYAHSIDEPVTQILYNKVQFVLSDDTTAGDADDSELAVVPIDPTSQYTIFEDVTNTTGYAFIRFFNGASRYSSYSSAIPYTGLVSTSVGKIIEQALGMTNEKISDLLPHDYLVSEVNNWQNEVCRQKDWDWEFDTITSLTVATSTQAYTIPSTLKYGYSDRSILQVRIDNDNEYVKIQYVDRRTFTQLDTDSPTGFPSFYTIWDSQLLLTPTPTSTYNGNTISMDVWKSITEVNDDGDSVTVPFFTIAPYYLAWKIETRKGNDTASEKWRQLYEARLAGEMRREHGQKQFPGFKVWGGFNS